MPPAQVVTPARGRFPQICAPQSARHGGFWFGTRGAARRAFLLPIGELHCPASKTGGPLMPHLARLLLALAALLIASAAWAQEPKGYLGADLQDITKDEADKLGWEAPRGVKVVRPRENGPAARAGLLAQDVIISLDGQEVENMER